MYAVQTNDTLQSIAKGAYGDGNLWYLIADANGLMGNADLRAGQVLTIPTRVANANNADTFRPYDPSKIANDTPTMLAQPQGEKGGCGVVGQIIVAVIAVVVAVYTGGIGGAMLGSLMGQAAGVAMGVQDDISWKQVALAGVSAGISFGVGEVVGPAIERMTGSALATRFVTAALSSAATQGVAVATGLQERFSWRSVAASAVGAGVGQVVGGALGELNAFKDFGAFGQGLAMRAISGFAGGMVTGAMRGGRVSATQVAVDAFGNALGDSIAAANGQGSSSVQQEDRLGNFISQNQGAWDRRYANYQQVVAAFSEGGDAERYPGFQMAGNKLTIQLSSGDSENMDQVALQRSREQLEQKKTQLQRNVDELKSIREWADSTNAPGLDGPTLPMITVTASREDDGSYEISEAARLSNYPASNSADTGTITNLPPTVWERFYLAPEVQHTMNHTITGKLVGGIANTLGTAWASFASPNGYNPATGKNLNLVQQRDGRIDTLINAAATVVTGGASTATRAELQAMKTEMASAQALRRAELNAKLGRSGNLDQDINARGALDPRHEIDRLVAEGHAVGRHGERVSELALDNRALHKYDPITGTTTDYFIRGAHNVGRNATQFTTNESLLQAEAYVRGSPAYMSAQADALANSLNGFAVKGVPLEDALGSNYAAQVFGKSRLGSLNNPIGTTPINFTDGSITSVFRKSPNGSWNLHTMYPEPK